MHALHLWRHTKSSWTDDTLDDHDRPLSKRGRRDAETMARHLAGRGGKPDLVLSSTAARARATLAPLLEHLKPKRVLLDREKNELVFEFVPADSGAPRALPPPTDGSGPNETETV